MARLWTTHSSAQLAAYLLVAAVSGNLSPTAVNADSVTADLNAPAQTIDHFAASDAWSMQNVGLWSETNRLLVADLLFSTNSGIGLSAWRFNFMAGFDPTVSPGTPWQRWRTGNGFLVASNQYDWSRQPGQRWFLSAAKARNVDQYIAMIYSPPTNFTRNGKVYCTDGLGSSNLKPGYEAAFGQWAGDVLAHFKTNPAVSERVTFKYVMPVNETYWEWNGHTQEGSRYANTDLIRLTTALNGALSARGLETEIVLAEAGDLPGLYQTRGDISSEYGTSYGNYLSALENITNLISRNLSAHSYFTDNPTNQLLQVRQALRAQLQARPHWRYWQSEYCVLGTAGPGRDLSIRTALDVARVIWADLAVADASAWHWWLSLSQADYKDGLLYTDFWQPGDEETLYCSKLFWMFGQWSRFIRPGWKRVALPGVEDVFGLMGAAFVDPASDHVVMVFVNHSGRSRVLTPGLKNSPSGKQLAFWAPWITSGFPSDNLSALPPVAAGREILVPPEAVLTLVGKVQALAQAEAPNISGPGDQTASPGDSLQLKIRIDDSDTPAGLADVRVYTDDSVSLPPTGLRVDPVTFTNAIMRELFVGFSGTTLNYLAAAPSFPNAPRARHSMLSFEAPKNLGGRYGTRLRGYVIPPQSGNYTFWIASRDASELYLSENENPVGKNRIAWVKDSTDSREWGRESNQQSAPVPLVAGNRYYVEAVHVAASGGDHLAVGWQLPEGTLERPIPGSRLSPWTNPLTNSVEKVLTLQVSTNATGTANVWLVATDTLGLSSTNQVKITIKPPVPVQPAKLNAQFDRGSLILSWPRDYLGWQLEVQTNAAGEGLGTNWTAVVGSQGTNLWTGVVDTGCGSTFFRLSLE